MSSASMASPPHPRQPTTAAATTTLPLNTTKRTSFQDLSGVKGAEGGVEAIVLRRRGSNSFKTMSTGGLVSNSPFTKRIAHTTDAPISIEATSPVYRPSHPASRIPTTAAAGAASPTATRKLSGGSRKASIEQLSRSSSNENNAPGTRAQDANASTLSTLATKTAALPRSRSTSPSVPFKPVRNPSTAAARAADTAQDARSTSSLTSTPFMPTRNNSETARRETASFAALKRNGLVSSSPFVQVLSNDGMPQSSTEASPPLPAAPYEIAPLAHESAPFWASTRDEGIEPPLSPKLASTVGLGYRPALTQAPLSGPSDRRIAGSSIPPPNTPPHQRTMSISISPGQSPLSALSPHRRGLRGPRELDYSVDEPDVKADKRLKRQPSGKTVTWAATEEVLEFEVDDRRESGVSMMSSGSEDAYYGRGDDSSEDGNVSLGFEEGGSVEVHDIDSSYADDDDDDEEVTPQAQMIGARTVEAARNPNDDDDDEVSQVSTADSQVEDMIDVIDTFMSQDSSYGQVNVDAFSPPQTTHAFLSSNSAHNYGSVSSPPFGDLVMQHSEASSSSQAGSTDDSTSVSSYGDDDDEADTTAKFDDAVVTTVSEPQFHQASVVKLASPIQLEEGDQVSGNAPFALPDIQKTSPFLPFEDDGAADSVVSMYMERNVQPLAPRRTASSQLLQEAAVSGQASTPVMGLFGAQPIKHIEQSSPQLSRCGSIMSERASTVSEASSSWLGSISSGTGRGFDRNGSVNSGSLFMSRDRLQQKMREHQALLGSESSTNHHLAGSKLDLLSQGNDHGTFPSDLISHVPSAKNKSATATTSSSSTIEILQARPAVRVTSATLSTDMLPNIIGSNGLSFEIGTPLTEQVAAELVSPLDRLQRGVDEKKDTENGWQSGDSLLGHGTAGDELEAEQDRQSLCVDERSRTKGRRRSSSTSDVPVAETTSIHEEEPKFRLPTHGFEQHLDAVLPGKGSGFSSTIEADLDDIFNSRDRSYRIHERRNVIHAADAFKAVERDPAKAWRRKRPSNMHEVNRSLSMMSISASASQRRPKNLSGQLFVILREAVFENMPMPQAKTSLRITLDNGKQKVEAGSRLLEKTVVIRSEFELVSSDSLEFDITFHAPPKRITTTATLSAPLPPASPTKSPRGLRALLSSPKKKKAAEAAAAAAAATAAGAQRASTPVQVEPFDPFYDFVAASGELATMHFVFANEASRCRLKRHRVNIPLEFKGMRKIAKGALSMDLLYVPAIPGVPRNQLAASMDDAIKGMELAECESKVTHEGVLTQLGGDTTVWRRRNFKLRSNRLVPYSEVTKMSHVEVDMSLVKSIRDLNAATADSDSIASDADDEAMDFSFRLVFKDKSVIDLYADDQESKQKWMDVLGSLLASPAVHRKAAPVWALTLRRLVAAGKA
ncbi:Bud site selection protein bud4 [Microbotryomycetes sp. JL201]|nr:Bud site selection protein bud4 [Microbotryomycetes sp. JL201]